MSFSPEDAIRHFLYEGIFSVLSGLLWENRPYTVLDFAGKFYGDPDGGWQTHLRAMMKALLGKERLEYTQATWPEVDIEQMPYPENTFDVVLCDQTLEHVQHPWVAAAGLHRVTKHGGLMVVATPGLYPIHPAPLDCWRILPDGYRVLFPETDWHYLTLDMWGTAERVGYEYLHNNAFPYGPPETTVEQAQKQPYYVAGSDERCPLQIWWVGRKL